MIDPRGLKLLDWADAVILTVPDAWSFGRLNNEDDWQVWGTAFVRADGFTQLNPPNPYEFKDWREWAMRMFTFLQDAK